VDSTKFTVHFDENSHIQKYRLNILKNKNTERDEGRKTEQEIEDEYGGGREGEGRSGGEHLGGES
jgi:hypothetical protein